MPLTNYLILAEVIMRKEDFINTKWDARDWSEDMKRAWQERMFEFGFCWHGGSREVLNKGIDFLYIYQDGEIALCVDLDYFIAHPYTACAYSFAFPETLTEQGQKHDSNKPRYDLLPPIAIDEMAKVMTFGAEKYAPDNWRHVDNAIDRYRAALLRHSFAMLRGEKLDPETGLPHAAHAMCCASFIVELEKE